MAFDLFGTEGAILLFFGVAAVISLFGDYFVTPWIENSEWRQNLKKAAEKRLANDLAAAEAKVAKKAT
ncbi:hypothetical protein CYMTET_13805 [Cymbomonas tetramitiformis]|uniref:Uncharacterized protein n=1 Tax=Cymbomonas tetramitiformis TaxID=36881 RepID=A0AAE0LB11_9CHLO|nr:hypothetical protein CYMTET_13805 [Cymbomonas tetramitiformis]